MPEDIHWQKYASRYRTLPSQLERNNASPGICVCIPVYAEPELIPTLDSLLQCQLPDADVEVILLFNRSNRMTSEEIRQHEICWTQTLDWIHQHAQPKRRLTFLPVYVEKMPDPKGGVGWARKLVMDEAARRLDQQGVILCLDADCTVQENYLIAVHHFFITCKECDAASIYFEHHVNALAGRKREAIIQYELHLRYLVQAMRWAGHPYAFHTVGSAMAVRRKAYLSQGGMNTRQAGEDFYFLQKFIEIGTLREITTTCVYPSARISSRVPFGTGRAMHQLTADEEDWKTTSLNTFADLKTLLANLHLIREISKKCNEENFGQLIKKETSIRPVLVEYLVSIGLFKKCMEISMHTATDDAFAKRFFRFFNGFSVIRYAHAMRDICHPDVPILEAAAELVGELKIPVPENAGIGDYLKIFRLADGNEKVFKS